MLYTPGRDNDPCYKHYLHPSDHTVYTDGRHMLSDISDYRYCYLHTSLTHHSRYIYHTTLPTRKQPSTKYGHGYDMISETYFTIALSYRCCVCRTIYLLRFLSNAAVQNCIRSLEETRSSTVNKGFLCLFAYLHSLTYSLFIRCCRYSNIPPESSL